MIFRPIFQDGASFSLLPTYSMGRLTYQDAQWLETLAPRTFVNTWKPFSVF